MRLAVYLLLAVYDRDCKQVQYKLRSQLRVYNDGCVMQSAERWFLSDYPALLLTVL